MNKIIILLAFVTTSFIQNGFSQDSTRQSQLSSLLPQYYNIKDALVSGNGDTAASKAEELIKTLNGIDYKVVSEGNINALLKDVTSISETKDIKKQRVYFANLSNNMATLAKTVKLSNQPVYKVNCPMKKANWLSSENVVRNPYYGSSMLTCGSVIETIN